MKNRGKKRKCPYCKTPFDPDARNKHYQQYCCETNECKRESHRVASARYRQKHRNDKKKKEAECERIKKWQREHPGYWKTKNNAKIISPDLLLRDIMQAQKVTSFPVLRDIVIYLHACLSGYIAHTTDWNENLLLRDFIASRMNRFYDKGIALSSESNINLLKEENYHDPEGNRKPRACETHA